ncbi:MAG: FAD-binding oxidoreductase [Actinobacteria bacterium]|jgi:alkyldihydroxyacetonephosphate synthase|nr:FAD-binding oxidoreductase [Actinomycetota bacterium]MBT3687902.1 FAD-binding oxidoreductase [Actinomycetota bacterium]MBT4036625.1 FAD-binding oxidoreductase [Actinomycetota bacterium]MBT4278636.1 FAD-binding oxidoreductase [Actinomycetota bacterium]MBT4342474.1 FAD-binding oxidoreductase [Actinomycetota bacterium]
MESETVGPTPPIDWSVDRADLDIRLAASQVEVPAEFLSDLEDRGIEVLFSVDDRVEASRDWWPLAQIWALEGLAPAIADAVVRPATTTEVADVVAACSRHGVPVTAAGGRSGVLGSSVPVHGGILLDLTGLAGILLVDSDSMVVEVAAGTFGDTLEADLAEKGFTVGHWPQSISLSTVGGWLACRGAGQLSNRYGKIEDLVVGLEVVLADGSVVITGGHARAAAGPDLTQVFVGSEGTLGIITRSWLRLHHQPKVRLTSAFGFESFGAANDACRRIMQRGATPAALRVYDSTEAAPRFDTGDAHVLLVLDEGDTHLVEADMAVVAEECTTADPLDSSLVEQWWEDRNDVAGLAAITKKGFVFDTMEVTVSWSNLDSCYRSVLDVVGAMDGVRVVSAHQSHAYSDGACLYFTFAARPEDPTVREAWYVAAWDVAARAALSAGASLSHHHGVGLNRARFMAEALGSGFEVLVTLKEALDPQGILNPGKMGLPDRFGEVFWP